MKDPTIGNMKAKQKISIWKLGFLLCVLSGFQIYAQKQGPEVLWVHFDRHLYLTGEKIFFKVYNTNYGEHRDHSRIVYLNIHDKKGALQAQRKMNMENGWAAGSFTIPISWPEDFYWIACFTKWNLQFPGEGVFVRKIPVYSQFEKADIRNDNKGPDPQLQNPPSLSTNSSKSIVIETSKLSYKRRESVTVHVLSDDTINCSISVSKLQEAQIAWGNPQTEIAGIGYAASSQQTKEHQMTLEGQAREYETEDPIQSAVLMLYKVGSPEFYRTSSQNGEITQYLSDFVGERQFQLFDMNPFQSKTTEFMLNTPGYLLEGVSSDQSRPVRDAVVNTYIANARLQKKIVEVFSSKDMDSLQSRQFAPIALVPDKVYDMSKFKSIRTLQDFFTEVVVTVNVLKSDKAPEVRMRNKETKLTFMESPWYLVDGYLTRDQDRILNLPFKNLIRVELFNSSKSILSQLDPVMIRSGLIAIYTDNYLLKDHIEGQRNIVRFQGISVSERFVPAVFDDSLLREHPNLNPLLYWNGNTSSDSKITFFTSDLMGEFLVEVHGVSPTGQQLYGKQTFTVNY